MTIRKRLALWYSGLLTLIIVIFSLAVITVSRITLLDTVDQVLSDAVRDVQRNIAPIPDRAFDPPEEILAFFDSEDIFRTPGVSVQIWYIGSGGEAVEPQLILASDRIARSVGPFDSNLIDTPVRHYASVMVGDSSLRVITQPFYSLNGTLLGVIQISTSMRSVAEANEQLLLITLISALICTAVSILLGLWLSRHLLKPVEKITETAASIVDADDLSTRLSWEGPQDELGKLAGVFNHTMERLEHLFDVQHRFIGDVSHELRTPLTSIIGNLELMERYGVDQSSLDAVHREAIRMNRMVNDLLLLTRADAGELQVDYYEVDFDAIVLAVYEDALASLKKRSLKIILERIDPVTLEGNADRLRQLVKNLLHNAIKFTSDNGEILLSVYREKDHAVLEVSDTGIGISEEDKKRIFDRFFQVDPARMQLDEGDGAGLGLSIARWIVDIHNGTITVESKLGEGSQFSVRLPLEQPDAAKNPSSTFVRTVPPLKVHRRQ